MRQRQGAARAIPAGRPRKWIRAEIERLDPVADRDRVYALVVTQLTPPSLLAINLFYTLGFLRQAGAPAGAIPVDRAGRGMVYSQADRRADETSRYFLEWAHGGASSEAVGRSIAEVRRMHDAVARHWDMPNHAFVHGTAAFALQLDRFLQVIGAAGLSENERIAQVAHWRDVALQLDVDDVPDTWEAMNRALDDYERDPRRFCRSVEGDRVAEALLDQFTRRFFRPRLRWLGRWLVASLLERHVLDALPLDPPPPAFARTVRLAVRLAVYARRHVLADPPEVIALADIVPHAGHRSGDRSASSDQAATCRSRVVTRGRPPRDRAAAGRPG